VNQPSSLRRSPGIALTFIGNRKCTSEKEDIQILSQIQCLPRNWFLDAGTRVPPPRCLRRWVDSGCTQLGSLPGRNVNLLDRDSTRRILDSRGKNDPGINRSLLRRCFAKTQVDAKGVRSDTLRQRTFGVIPHTQLAEPDVRCASASTLSSHLPRSIQRRQRNLVYRVWGLEKRPLFSSNTFSRNSSSKKVEDWMGKPGTRSWLASSSRCRTVDLVISDLSTPPGPDIVAAVQ